MASIPVNLKTIYSEKIHVPTMAGRVNKSPLYALRENTDDPEIKGLVRDELWKTASQKTYNSPTNVRRLIMSERWVITEFYKPFIQNGAPVVDGCWRHRTVDKNVVKAKEFIISGGKSGDLAYGGASESYNITGNMLAPIRQWVLSNIEEIIIDETCFFSSTINDGKTNIPKLIAKTNSLSAFNPKQKAFLWDKLLRVSDSDLSKQFPRLKLIAIVPGLTNKVVYDELLALKKSLSSTVFDTMADQFIENDCMVKRLKSKDSIDMGDIKVRTYYRFDAEVLRKYADTFAKSLSAEREEVRQQKAAAEAAKIEASKCELEKTLEELEAQYGINHAKTVLLLTKSGLSRDDAEALRKQFTKDGLRFW